MPLYINGNPLQAWEQTMKISQGVIDSLEIWQELHSVTDNSLHQSRCLLWSTRDALWSLGSGSAPAELWPWQCLLRMSFSMLGR